MNIAENVEQRLNHRQEPAENQLLGYVTTIDGEQEVRWRNGKQVLIAKELTETFKGLPKKYKERHDHALQVIYALIQTIKQTQNDRRIPLTRVEVTAMGVPKKDLKELERMGLVRTESTVLMDKASKQRYSGECVIYLTEQGRCYVETKKEEWDSELAQSPQH